MDWLTEKLKDPKFSELFEQEKEHFAELESLCKDIDSRDAHITALEAQLRERTEEVNGLRVSKSLIARAEAAESALAAAREENERMRDKVCPHLKRDERGVESCWARDTVDAYRSRADDAGRVERAARALFNCMVWDGEVYIRKDAEFALKDEDGDDETWTEWARAVLAAADGEGKP